MPEQLVEQLVGRLGQLVVGFVAVAFVVAVSASVAPVFAVRILASFVLGLVVLAFAVLAFVVGPVVWVDRSRSFPFVAFEAAVASFGLAIGCFGIPLEPPFVAVGLEQIGLGSFVSTEFPGT